MLAGLAVPGADPLARRPTGSARPPRAAARRPPRPRAPPPRGWWRRCRPRSAGSPPRPGSCRGSSGPTSGRRSDSSAAAAAACWTSTLAITCGRWLTVAISRSWVSASIACGRAPRSEIARWRRSYRTPLERSVGVRYQRAPSNRSARAFSTPAVSAPASGWPPMKRSSCGPRTCATSAPLVEPTSVTTASSPLDASASETSSGSAPTGAAQKTTSAPSTAPAIESSIRSTVCRSSARSRGGRVRIEAADLGAEPPLRRQPDRAADQPDAEDGDSHPRRRASTAPASRSRITAVRSQSRQRR